MLVTSQHYETDDTGGSLRFIMHNRTDWIRTSLLGVVGCGIFASVFLRFTVDLTKSGLLSALGDLAPLFFVNALLLLMTFTIISVELLWQLVGKEDVEIANDYIALRHYIFNWVTTRTYRATSINGLFVSRDKGHWLLTGFSREFSILNFKRGKIAFNNGKTLFGSVNTFRFGAILGDDEAEQIVRAIHQRFPQYKYKSKGATR